MASIHIALLVGVGPAANEVERLRDLVAAVQHCEPFVQSIVLIDDALSSRSLPEQFTVLRGVKMHSITHPRQGDGSGVWGGLTEGILLGLQWIAANVSEATLVLKIDTDALVIAPFARKAADFFAAKPPVGLIGLYDRYCSGEPRTFEPWNRATRNYALPIGFHRRDPIKSRRLRWQMGNAAGRQRQILLRARANGYRWGEHCLGGAYLLRAEAVRDMQANGFFDEAAFWRSTQMSEDVVVGAYTKAAGWDLSGFAAKDEIFGLAHYGLPFPPAELLARGYSIIHAVKNDPHLSEAQIRAFFRERRL